MKPIGIPIFHMQIKINFARMQGMRRVSGSSDQAGRVV
jgi:hypothetical protein